MSITREFAKSQIARMGNLEFPPQNATETKEIQDALMTCSTEDQCKAIVTDWIRENPEFPKPSRVYAIIESRRLATQEFSLGAKPLEHCPTCHDWGSYNDAKGNPQWCTCPAAQQLREDHPNWLEMSRKLNRKSEFLSGHKTGSRTMEILKR